MNTTYQRPLFFAFSKNTPAGETAFPLRPPRDRRMLALALETPLPGPAPVIGGICMPALRAALFVGSARI
jgi:hypothetical protein